MSAARKRLNASWSTRWIDMPRSCSRQRAGDHHLGVGRLHRVVGLDRRGHAGAVQQAEDPQRAVEHDLQVHPGVVAHAEALRGHLLGVPARLQLVAGVGRREQARELAVALARRVDLHRRDRLARRQRARPARRRRSISVMAGTARKPHAPARCLRSRPRGPDGQVRSNACLPAWANIQCALAPWWMRTSTPTSRASFACARLRRAGSGKNPSAPGGDPSLRRRGENHVARPSRCP